MWANPQIITEYLGFMQRMVRRGDEDYRPVAALVEADAGVTTTGAGVIELSYSYSTPLNVYAGDYLWVGISLGAAGSARGRQQADATVSDQLGVLTFIDHSKFTGTPTNSDNLWHTNPDNYAYRQEIRGTFISEDELLVQRNAVPVYSGKNVIDVDTTDDGVLEIASDKITLHFPSAQVIVSEDTPPDNADVAEGDRNKIYIQTNADGYPLEFSYLRVVDEHLFTLSSVAFSADGEAQRGFRLDGNHGHLSPLLNIIRLDYTPNSFPNVDLRFDAAVQEPIDYTTITHLTLYTRRKGTENDWIHHVLTRQTDHHQYTSAQIDAGYLGDGVRYDMILRTGDRGSGTSSTVPEANRVSAYPGGFKREYLPSFDELDNLTRLYDIIVQEEGSEDGTVRPSDVGRHRRRPDGHHRPHRRSGPSRDGNPAGHQHPVHGASTLPRAAGYENSGIRTYGYHSLECDGDYGWQCNRKRRVHP